MSDGSAYDQAARELGSASPVANLCRPFVDAFAVGGAAISTIGGIFSAQTVCASDGLSAKLDELQIDLGEGPCWDAIASGRPVQEPDIRSASRRSWPALTEALQNDEITALFAFPLFVGRLPIGSVDLYSVESRTFTDEELDQGWSLASLAAHQLLRRQLGEAGGAVSVEDGPQHGAVSRRVVHQATGMVLAQLGLSPADALLVLRAHAFANGQSVREVAEEVVDRTLDLSS